MLILGFTPSSLAKELAENDISQAVFSEEYAKELSEQALRQNVQVKIKYGVLVSICIILCGRMYQIGKVRITSELR